MKKTGIKRGTMQHNDPISRRIRDMTERVSGLIEKDWYHYLIASEALRGSKVVVKGREMLMLASYSYLDLIEHPRIKAAAKKAIDEFSTGTHGVRLLAGTTRLHEELEQRIASFKERKAAATYSSGYVTNMTVISTLCGRHDVVLSDRLNHASIVDGCRLGAADFVRFRHNDMDDLKSKLEKIPSDIGKFVVVDAVFSMDGDIINLPAVKELCVEYDAWLMVDEAHSVGVLGKTGHGIEEHFDMPGSIDICMGTLSKAIPSVGGYIAGDEDLIRYLKHTSRAFIFSAALPPVAAAAAIEAFNIIEEEPERVPRVQRNMKYFINRLNEEGFSTLNSETPIVPIMCGDDEKAWEATRLSHAEDVFVLPVVSPAVPDGGARLRACVTAAHSLEEIDFAVDVFRRAAKVAGIL
jgi:glycine C-acetyltransferase